MRVSKAGLLVTLAFAAPFLVELRTVLSWVGIELSVLESVALGAAVVAAIVVWAFLPEGDEDGGGSGRNLSNGD